jgi:rod shape-determining protein MreC
LERTRVQGVLKGGGGNLPQLNYILNEHPVAAGDKVVTSGLDQIYPKGLLVGTVFGVSEGKVYKVVSVQPSTPLDQLESVLVILESPAEQTREIPRDTSSRP